MTEFPTAAVARLGYYNGERYDVQTNPYGMAIGGHRVNFPPSLNDTSVVVNYVGAAAAEIAAFVQQTAADRAQTGQDRQAAAESAAAAARFDPAQFTTKGEAEANVRDGVDEPRNTLKKIVDWAFAKAGGILSGDIEILKAVPSLWFHTLNVKRARWVLDPGGNIIWQDAGGQNHFYIAPNGAVWTQEVGDLRAALVARVERTGDMFTGDVTIKDANMMFARGANRRYIHNDGAFVGFLGNDGNWDLQIGDDGSVITAQFGDLNTRIETRAAAFADDRLATARGEYANHLKNFGSVQGFFLQNADINRIVARTSAGDKFVVASVGNAVNGLHHSGNVLEIHCIDGQGVRGVNTFASDERIKIIHGPAQEIGLATINRIEHIDFNYKDELHRDPAINFPVGWSAQNLQSINPQWTSEFGGLLAPDPTGILPFMTKSIQELGAQVDALTARVAALESMVSPT